MVPIRDIGINLDSCGNTSALHELELALARLRAIGYRLVEIDPSPFALIIDGELRQRQLARFRDVLGSFDLRYSIHGFMRLNLAYDPRHDLCRRIMHAQIDLCRAIGATRLVYHSGLQAFDAVRHGVRNALLTERELEEGVRREVAALKDLSPVAADAGVVIAIENGDPHRWEYGIIQQFGLPRSEIVTHHARLRIGPIVRQLEAIGHPNVRMTLDVAHLYLAAHDVGFDYLDAVSEAAPWVAHLHVSDNDGRLDWGHNVERDRWAFGEADMHMPPGWGSIPYREVFRRMPGYTGDLILEIQSGFQDYLDDARQSMQVILNGIE